jgi:hypothetical protein
MVRTAPQVRAGMPTLTDEVVAREAWHTELPADVIMALRRGAIAARALDVQTRPRPASPDFAARFPFYMDRRTCVVLLACSRARRGAFLAVRCLRRNAGHRDGYRPEYANIYHPGTKWSAK